MDAVVVMGVGLVVAGIFAIAFARTQTRAGFERGIASTAEERAALGERVIARDREVLKLQQELTNADETIAKNSGSSLGGIKKASMGVFQITGQNSNEDYSSGGVFNTSSKNKTASITMKIEYAVK